MQVVHTAADPPNHGRINLAISGCTANRRNALKNMVTANAGRADRRSTVRGNSGNALTDDKGVNVVGSFIRLDCFQIA